MSDTNLKVGWLGAGKMGNPMCRRVLATGAAVAVYDTVDANSASVVAAGGRKAATVAEAARGGGARR